MSFTTFSFTREDMKSEESAQAAWQGYRNPPSMSTRLLPLHDLAPLSPLGSSYSEASGNNYHMVPSSQHLSSRMKNHPTTMPRPPLKSHHSYPSLKRSYQTFEEIQYSQVGPEFYDVVPEVENQTKPTIHPDHRLLSFGQTQGRHILDQYGRPDSMEITAQIHGMFFLSEIATNSGEVIVIQPELTCYRRNLFQISGSVAGPRGSISVLTEQGQTVPIVSQELSIFATESVDDHAIRLIVIPWKTPPPNSPEVPPNQEQEPPPIPLDSNIEGSEEINNEVTVHPIAWRRLQFRVATANNGRRKELQQHFVLRLNLTATLADSTKLCIAEAATVPIVVRGRSPRNFQARKEIPLVGSSASPRGQAARSSPADKKVALLPEKNQYQKPQHMDQPKRPFQIHGSKFPPSSQMLRAGFGYRTTSQQQSEQATVANTPAYTPPQIISQEHLHTGEPHSGTTRLNSLPVSQSQPTVPEETAAHQFYQMAPAPIASSLSVQPIDDNSRPTKSGRHIAPTDMSNLSSYPPFEERIPPPYSVLGQADGLAQQSRGYFPDILESESWSTAENGHVLYSTSIVPPSQQHFTFSSQLFAKNESLPGSYTWSAR